MSLNSLGCILPSITLFFIMITILKQKKKSNSLVIRRSIQTPVDNDSLTFTHETKIETNKN
jgi:hypothetical protein